jgi:hypothetical protein
MTPAEIEEIIRNHFEEFVTRKNLGIGEVNFALDFVDHGAGVLSRWTASRTGRTMQYVGMEAATRVLWHRNLEDPQPADSRALGLPGESSPRLRLGLEERK